MVDSTKIQFLNRQGHNLSGLLETPLQGSPKAYLLFAHCFTCSKNLNAVTRIGRTLVAQGFGVLRFDFTGLGESEGDFADTNFSSNVDEVLEWQQKENKGVWPIIVKPATSGGQDGVACCSSPKEVQEAFTRDT